MEAMESATQLTLALIGKVTPINMGANNPDPQAMAKWVQDSYKTILVGVTEAIKEVNKQQ
jgi:hypothetical protein